MDLWNKKICTILDKMTKNVELVIKLKNEKQKNDSLIPCIPE